MTAGEIGTPPVDVAPRSFPWNDAKMYTEILMPEPGALAIPGRPPPGSPTQILVTLKDHLPAKEPRDAGLQIALLTRACLMLMTTVENLSIELDRHKAGIKAPPQKS